MSFPKSTRSPRFPGHIGNATPPREAPEDGDTDIVDLNKRIQWIEWLLEDAQRLKLSEETVLDQEQRLSQLRNQRRLLTTCHCGEGDHIRENSYESLRCKCNNTDFAISSSRL